MEKRTVSAVIGDWSDDGHGKTRTVLYLLEGDDLSDGKLNDNYNQMEREIGNSIFNYCEGYEENRISDDFYELLQKFGLKDDYVVNNKDDVIISFDLDNWRHYKEVPLGKILEIYLKVKITAIPMPDLLFGGYSGILKGKSFGYGLFC